MIQSGAQLTDTYQLKQLPRQRKFEKFDVYLQIGVTVGKTKGDGCIFIEGGL